MLEGFDKWLMEKINERDSSIVFEKNADIYNHYRSLKIVEFEAFIIKTVKKQDVTMAVVDGNKLNASIVECSGQVNTKYELIADIYSDFVNTVNTFPIKESGFDEFLIQTKEEFLVNKIITNPLTVKNVYVTNSEINFINDNNIRNCIDFNFKEQFIPSPGSTPVIPYISYIHSLKTWAEVYEPIYMKAMENLIEDGLCDPTKTFRDFFRMDTQVDNVSIIVPNNNTKYNVLICEMIQHEMKKVFCRMTVSGKDFPIEISEPGVPTTT
jgi:hypothetical protein